MPNVKTNLVDVGMRGLPFPIRAASRVAADGQQTIANISVTARIDQQFEGRWVDRFIQTLHVHRDLVSAGSLRRTIPNYLDQLGATMARVDFHYPFFIEKEMPVSKEKCLVRYMCTYSAKVSSGEARPRILFKMEIPVITTYTGSSPDRPGGLFGQLSVVNLELETGSEIFPEDLVDLADRHAVMPVYSFMTDQDQAFIMKKAHSMHRSSVEMIDEIRDELGRDGEIVWHSVTSANYGMLHSYNTFIGTEKSMWVPFSGYEADGM